MNYEEKARHDFEDDMKCCSCCSAYVSRDEIEACDEYGLEPMCKLHLQKSLESIYDKAEVYYAK